MNYIITGGTGFIGLKLRDLLMVMGYGLLVIEGMSS